MQAAGLAVRAGEQLWSTERRGSTGHCSTIWPCCAAPRSTRGPFPREQFEQSVDR
jgi:hypothetical protein